VKLKRDRSKENVLLGVLSGKNSLEHLNWVFQKNLYYMPLLKKQPKQYTPKWLILYIPKTIQSPGAIRYKALIEGLKISTRQEIDTPWLSHQKIKELQIIYNLESVEELSPPILNQNKNAKEQRISQPRWTTELALERANTINELLLETESDWWLYDNLKNRKIEFSIKAKGSPNKAPLEDESRVMFYLLSSRIVVSYRRKTGFLTRNKYGAEKAFLHLENMLEYCLKTEK